MHQLLRSQSQSRRQWRWHRPRKARRLHQYRCRRQCKLQRPFKCLRHHCRHILPLPRLHYPLLRRRSRLPPPPQSLPSRPGRRPPRQPRPRRPQFGMLSRRPQPHRPQLRLLRKRLHLAQWPRQHLQSRHRSPPHRHPRPPSRNRAARARNAPAVASCRSEQQRQLNRKIIERRKPVSLSLHAFVRAFFSIPCVYLYTNLDPDIACPRPPMRACDRQCREFRVNASACATSTVLALLLLFCI
jgi:hypothetical protein